MTRQDWADTLSHARRSSRRNHQTHGKKALITGGNSGIGLATAPLFVAEVAEVAITGRDQQTLDEAVAELGSKARGFRVDVTVAEDRKELFAELSKDFGKLDIVFANAGISDRTPTGATDEAVAYAATKGEVVSIAADFAPRNIRVNVVAPGATKTPIWKRGSRANATREQSVKLADFFSSMIPLGRWGEPEELAKAVLFLASEDSSYINAVELVVDGGLTGAPFAAPILRG